LIATIQYLIQNEAESPLLDFKQQEYVLGNPSKHELLKDISAMANVSSAEDKFIVIGVIEKDGSAIGLNSLTEITDDSKYQQYVRDYIEPEINFEYKKMSINGYDLAYFRIFNNEDRPYLFKKDVKDSQKIIYRAGDGFIRRGSSTTKLVRSHFDQIYSTKNQRRDRKSDLNVTADIRQAKNPRLKNHYYLNVSAQNLSKSSISLNFELKISRGDFLEVKPEYQLMRELTYAENDGLDRFTKLMGYIPSIGNSFKVLPDGYLVTSHWKGGLTIGQQDSFEDVFNQHSLFEVKKDTVLHAELTVRSDDFSDGALRRIIELPVQARKITK
jgi:hypothetical protein